jgi:hypothetical protein
VAVERDVEIGKAKFLGSLATLAILSAWINLGLDGTIKGNLRTLVQFGFISFVWWRGSREGLLIIGTVLLLIGIASAIGGYTSDLEATHRAFVLFAAFCWTSSGILFITSLDVRAYLDHRVAIRMQLADKNDERWGISRGVQIVGRACGVCDRRFAAERDAATCETCAGLFHTGRCLASHRHEAHAGQPGSTAE